MFLKKGFTFIGLGTIATISGLVGSRGAVAADLTIPLDHTSPDYISQGNISQGNISPDNTLNHTGSGSDPVNSTASPETVSPNSEYLAQFFPYANLDEQVVMVQGLGMASVAAETAEIELVFVNYDPYYDPYACYYEESSEATSETDESEISEEDALTIPPGTYPSQPCPAPAPADPISRATLQPVIDALTATGVQANQLDVRLPSDPPSDDDYAAFYYPDSASISFTLNQPSRQRVQDIMTAMDEAVVDLDTLYLQDRYVTYTLSDQGCDALEREAYQDAITNARRRASVLAEALGVNVGDTPSVAAATLSSSTSSYYSYYPSYCDSTAEATAAYGYYASPSYYDAQAPAEVRLQREVYVTYPIRGR